MESFMNFDGESRYLEMDPEEPGDYTLMVQLKDTYGNVVLSQLKVSFENEPEEEIEEEEIKEELKEVVLNSDFADQLSNFMKER